MVHLKATLKRALSLEDQVRPVMCVTDIDKKHHNGHSYFARAIESSQA